MINHCAVKSGPPPTAPHVPLLVRLSMIDLPLEALWDRGQPTTKQRRHEERKRMKVESCLSATLSFDRKNRRCEAIVGQEVWLKIADKKCVWTGTKEELLHEEWLTDFAQFCM